MKGQWIFIIFSLIFLFTSCGGGGSDDEDGKKKLEFQAIADSRKKASAPMRTKGGYNFSTYAPKAKYVSLVGDFNNWIDNRTPMEMNKHGLWSITVPLKKGIYSYKFNIDGVWVIDNNNPVVAKDKMGDRRSIIEVKEDTEYYKKPVYYGFTNAQAPVISRDGIFFTYKDKFASKVSVAGTFNNWEKDQYYLRKNKNGVWSAYVQIAQGEYYYKFNVDGIWKHDSNNQGKKDDNQGGYKSKLLVNRDIDDRPHQPIVIDYEIVRFSFYNKDLPSNYHISIIGSFNNWQTNMNIMTDFDFDKEWVGTMRLREGEYYYQYVLVGKTFLDPLNKQSATSPDGREANYLKVSVPKGKYNVKFTYNNLKAKEVFLVGDFNNWNPEIDRFQKDHTGLWYFVKQLPKGKYSYHYIVDKEWILDPSNPYSVHDLNGDFNSYVEIK